MSKYKFCYVVEVSGRSPVPEHLQFSILRVLRECLVMICTMFNTKRESVKIKIGEIDGEDIKKVKFSPLDT